LKVGYIGLAIAGKVTTGLHAYVQSSAIYGVGECGETQVRGQTLDVGNKK